MTFTRSETNRLTSIRHDVDADVYFVQEKNGDVFPLLVAVVLTIDGGKTWNIDRLYLPGEIHTLLPTEYGWITGADYYLLAKNKESSTKSYTVPIDRLSAFQMRTFFDVDSGSITEKLKDLVK